MKRYGYARVSSNDQNLARQIDALRQYVHDDLIFKDKASGKDMQRVGYQYLRAVADVGDEVYIMSLDRLGRNKQDIKDELEYFRRKGVVVRILDLPTTMQSMDSFGDSDIQRSIFDMINNVLIEVLGTMAEQERVRIRQRQKEGIEAAKARGKHLGRPRAEYPDAWDSVYAEWQDGNITARRAMETLGLKRTTFYKLVKRQKEMLYHVEKTKANR